MRRGGRGASTGLMFIVLGGLALVVSHVWILGQDKALEDADRILREAGVVGLCHPTTNRYAPSFPQCSTDNAPIVALANNETTNATSTLIPVVVAGAGAGAAGAGTTEQDRIDEEEDFIRDRRFYIQNGVLAFVCVCTAAIAAGLTMGLMSLDPLVLHIKMRAGASEAEKKQAAKLLPLVKQHHRLLVTLLLLNSMANEALPLFLDKLVPSYMAVILSVTLVLFFGEIIPSAVFTGPDQVKIAASLTPLVQLFFCLLAPLAIPIAKMLDCVLHDDEVNNFYNRGELSALVRIQYEERLAEKQRRRKERRQARLHSMHEHEYIGGIDLPPTKDFEMKKSVAAHKKGIYQGRDSFQLGDVKRPRTLKERDTTSFSARRSSSQASHDTGKSSPSRRQEEDKSERALSIHYDEVNMVEGALTMGTKTAMDVYTPMRKVFAIPVDTILDERNVVKIYSSGFSRIPVFKPNPSKPKDITAIRGILMTKQLIVVNPSDKRCVDTLPVHIPFCVSPTTNLIDLINLFQTGGKATVGGHLALVCARPLLAGAALERDEPVPEMAGLMGVITLEDVLEELLQEEIYDEMDKLERQHNEVARWAFRKWRVFVEKKRLRREQGTLVEAEPKMLAVVEQTMEQFQKQSAVASEETPLVGGSSNGNSENQQNNKGFFGLFA